MKQKFEKSCAFQDYINEYLNSGAEVAPLARDVEGKKKKLAALPAAICRIIL